MLLNSPAVLSNFKAQLHTEIWSFPSTNSVAESWTGLLGAYHRAGHEFLIPTPMRMKEWISDPIWRIVLDKKAAYILINNATDINHPALTQRYRDMRLHVQRCVKRDKVGDLRTTYQIAKQISGSTFRPARLVY